MNILEKGALWLNHVNRSFLFLKRRGGKVPSHSSYIQQSLLRLELSYYEARMQAFSLAVPCFDAPLAPPESPLASAMYSSSPGTWSSCPTPGYRAGARPDVQSVRGIVLETCPEVIFYSRDIGVLSCAIDLGHRLGNSYRLA